MVLGRSLHLIMLDVERLVGTQLRSTGGDNDSRRWHLLLSKRSSHKHRAGETANKYCADRFAIQQFHRISHWGTEKLMRLSVPDSQTIVSCFPGKSSADR